MLIYGSAKLHDFIRSMASNPPDFFCIVLLKNRGIFHTHNIQPELHKPKKNTIPETNSFRLKIGHPKGMA